MRKILLSTLLVAFAFFIGNAVEMSSYSLSILDNIKGINNLPASNLKIHSVENGEKYIDAFIELASGSGTTEIENLGVKIAVRAGDILTASIPVSQIDNLVNLDYIERLDFARELFTKNDKARSLTGMSLVQEGTGLPQSYTGKGVVYGTCDQGIDFDHVAFMNVDGTPRIKSAYLPSNERGTKVTGNVYDIYGNMKENWTFPGSAFSTAKEYLNLTDYPYGSHGTHTIGIAAGGNKDNVYYGMAPEADIVACGASYLSDVNIMNSISYVFGYAQKNNQPAVVNLSLGGNLGPHDGTSLLTKMIDNIAGPGRIVVISAGNEGDAPMSIKKEFTEDSKEIKTLFNSPKYGLDYSSISGNMEIWSKDKAKCGIKFVIMSNLTKSIVYTSDEILPTQDYATFSLNSDTDAKFAKYCKGQITMRCDITNSKYNAFTTVNATMQTTNYKLGMVLTGEAGTEINIWGDNDGLQFANGGLSSWTAGTPECSINEMATGKNSISVGAYSSRKSYTLLSGVNYQYQYSTLNDIVPFSSYGIDMNGVSRPDIVAPGFVLISSINGHDTNYDTTGSSRNDLAVETTMGDAKQRWGIMYGTSMAAPCVSGIIATWLQAYPQLTSDDVKTIFAKTAAKDSYVTGGNPIRWGAGKIDGYNGLIEVLKLASVEGALTENQPIVIYPNPSNGVFSFFAPNESGNITVSVYSLNGMLVTRRSLDCNNEEVTIDFSNELQGGIYIVNITGVNTNYNSRIIIKK